MVKPTLLKRAVITGLLAAAVGLGFSAGDSVEAASLQSAIQRIGGKSESNPAILPDSLPNKSGLNVVVPGDHTYLNAKYSFVPMVTSKTEVVHSGSGHHWKSVPWHVSVDSLGQPRNTPYYAVKAVDHPDIKGKAWVKYTNVGTFNGKTIDLKITINDWETYFDTVQNIAFRRDEIAVSMGGYEWVDMTWQFLDAASGNPVNVSGYFTFGDIDINQGIEFSKASSDAIDAVILEPKVMTSGNSSKLQYTTTNGQYYIYDEADASEKSKGVDEDVPDNSRDVRYRFSAMYADQSQLRFRWKSNYGGRAESFPRSRLYYHRDNQASGDYMFYEIDKPLATLPTKPSKSGKVDPLTGKGNYTIKHVVPQESDKFYYTNYSLVDEVKPGLKNPKVTKITDQFGNNVTSWFDIAMNSKKAVASAKGTTLKNPAFYGNTYTVTLTAEVDYDYVNSSGDTSFSFMNDAINGTNHHETETDSATPPAAKQLMTVKHINQDNGKILKEEKIRILPGSAYKYDSIYHGTDYGTEGKLENVKVLVNGADKGKQSNVSGEMPNSTMTVDFYYRSPFNVSIRHFDDDSGKEIHFDKNFDKKFKGSTWTYNATLPTAKNAFVQDGVRYPYSPVNPSKSGTINFQNGDTDYRYELDFRYTKPNIDVGLQSVRIFTDDNDAGLPIEIDFDMKSIDEGNWGGEDRWATTQLNVKIIDKSDSDKVIYDKNHSTKSLRDKTLKWVIPKTGLKVDEMRNYEVVLSAPDKKQLYVRPGHERVTTRGYTASEEVIKLSSNDMPWNRSVASEWVAMTEKSVGDTSVTEHMEGLKASVDKTLEMPTGYGHGKVQPIETWTKLDTEHLPVVAGEVYADPELSDGDYDENAAGKHVLDVSEAVTKTNAGKKAITRFSFPQTYVTEGGAGDVIVSNTQPAGSANAGKKMYIPVWLKNLGSYEYTFKSTEPIGRNHVQVVIEQFVDVESYMFAHSDSETLNKDALLLQPTAENWFKDFTTKDPFEARNE